ncbi:MAG: hypothetical protein JSS98_00870 [Bacteroidetes bacterium]|nr:hypothetical protein [Bacteroidota bacterium]
MRFFVLIVLSIIVLLSRCKERTKQNNIENVKGNIAHDSVVKLSPQQAILKVSAHLIYDDGTVSSFDVINDKTIALWNTIIGSGDALKPSNNTRINLTGNLDSMNVRIKNGNKLILDTNILHSVNTFEFTIKNTGCKEVYVSIVKNKNVLYNDTIPFHCGE